MFKCKICNKEFQSKRSLSSHKNWHNSGYARKSKIGAAIGRNKINNNNKKELNIKNTAIILKNV